MESVDIFFKWLQCCIIVGGIIYYIKTRGISIIRALIAEETQDSMNKKELLNKQKMTLVQAQEQEQEQQKKAAAFILECSQWNALVEQQQLEKTIIAEKLAQQSLDRTKKQYDTYIKQQVLHKELPNLCLEITEDLKKEISNNPDIAHTYMQRMLSSFEKNKGKV